jgi:putative nucleotidyltransferase with HDIG domain
VAGERIVFLLDEVELAAKNEAFDLNFFSALRHIAARPGICFVTATDCRLHELEIAGREIGSPFADLFSVVRLRPLEAEAAWRSLCKLSSEAGIDLESEREFILELAGGSAYCLQVVAYEVVECKRDSMPLTEEQRHYVASRAFEQVEPVFSIMWERLEEPRRQAAVSAQAEDPAAVEVEGFTSLTDGQALPQNRLVERFLADRSREQGARIEDLHFSDSPDRSTMYSVVRVLMRAVEGRDRYARGHADEVARLAAAISLEMGCSPEITEAVRIAARLHDIGRVSISDLILLKPGPLSELETEIMRTHPLIGAQILDALEFPWAVKPAVRYHHERVDGSGYPEGLQGNEIPLPARIVAVADVMAAMTTDRPYRRALPLEEALAELTVNAGLKYDAAAVNALCRVVERGPM